MKGSEAAEGEGAAKMASSSSGPSAAGVSALDPAVSSGASSSGNQGGWGVGRGLRTAGAMGTRARPGRAPVTGDVRGAAGKEDRGRAFK